MMWYVQRLCVPLCAPVGSVCPRLRGLRSAQHPSESLPASYGPGAGMRVCVFACAPLCPSVGSVLILASSALLRAPLRASRSATAPEQGRGHQCLAGVSVYPLRGVIFGEALYPIPSHHTCTVGSSVGSPRRLLNDRDYSFSSSSASSPGAHPPLLALRTHARRYFAE